MNQYLALLHGMSRRKLSVPETYILLSLQEHGDQGNTDFMKRMGLSSQLVAAKLFRLSTLKYIKPAPRGEHAGDKRRQPYALTKLGRDILTALTKTA